MHFYFQGKPTLATMEKESKQYGEIDAKSYIPGAEILLREGQEVSTVGFYYF